jgi:hypothetical protein
MPGDLAEKIKLWSVLNRILKNNRYIDSDHIEADLATLKTKVNTLLNDILGIEHTVDNITEYNDTSLKESIEAVRNDFSVRIEQIRSDTKANTNKLSGIENTSTKINIKKTAEIGFDNTVNDANDSSKVSITPGWISLINKDASYNNQNQILIGNGTTDGGIDILSSNLVSIATLHSYYWIRLHDAMDLMNDISDVNGVK